MCIITAEYDFWVGILFLLERYRRTQTNLTNIMTDMDVGGGGVSMERVGEGWMVNGEWWMDMYDGR